MLKSHIAALCICPALLAPPVLVAVHKPARHAVAHLLQRAATRLDDHPAPATPAPPVTPALPAYANVPCAPTLGDASGPIEGVLLPFAVPQLASGGSSNDVWVPVTGGGVGGFGGGYFGSAPTPPMLPSAPGGIVTPPPMSSAPEPAAWALMVTGFVMVGGVVRTARAA